MTIFTAINVPVPGSRNPVEYVNGLTASWVSNTKLLLSAGSCSDSLNNIDMRLDTPTTIDADIVGAGGIDVGALGASSFYYVYVIGSSSGIMDAPTSAMISLSATAPILPYGYDSFRMVDIKLTDGSSHFVLSYTSGYYNEREFIYDAPKSVLSAAGSATYAAITGLSGAVPPLAISTVSMSASLTPNTAANALYLRPTGATSSNGYALFNAPVKSVASVSDVECVSFLASGSSSIDYKTSESTDAATLLVKSFTFEV